MNVHRALFLLIFGAACSKGQPKDDKVASCDVPASSVCREYRGDNLALGVEQLAKICDIGNNNKLKETPCPADRRIGACTMMEGTDIYYTGYAIPQAELEAWCGNQGGKFRTK